MYKQLGDENNIGLSRTRGQHPGRRSSTRSVSAPRRAATRRSIPSIAALLGRRMSSSDGSDGSEAVVPAKRPRKRSKAIHSDHLIAPSDDEPTVPSEKSVDESVREEDKDESFGEEDEGKSNSTSVFIACISWRLDFAGDQDGKLNDTPASRSNLTSSGVHKPFIPFKLDDIRRGFLAGGGSSANQIGKMSKHSLNYTLLHGLFMQAWCGSRFYSLIFLNRPFESY